MKAWILNGNGISFLTPAEQDKVTASTNPNLRFKAQHGFVSSDSDGSPDEMPHLWCGDNIVGTWAEPTAVTAPPAQEIATSGDTAAILTELRAQTRIMQDIANSCRSIAESSGAVARAVQPQPVAQMSAAPKGEAS